MSFLTRLFGKPEKEIKEIASDPAGEEAPVKTKPAGTTLRSDPHHPKETRTRIDRPGAGR
jgi:hypothetical protein